jgi:hypothetical protein
MSKPNQSPQPRRGPLWLLFRAPGAFLLWAEYHFPKCGAIACGDGMSGAASTRRLFNPNYG